MPLSVFIRRLASVITSSRPAIQNIHVQVKRTATGPNFRQPPKESKLMLMNATCQQPRAHLHLPQSGLPLLTQVEMYLIAGESLTLSKDCQIAKGERILMEVSRKFRPEQLRELAFQAGFLCQVRSLGLLCTPRRVCKSTFSFSTRFTFLVL